MFFDQAAQVICYDGSKNLGHGAEEGNGAVSFWDFIVRFTGFSEDDCGEVFPRLIISM